MASTKSIKPKHEYCCHCCRATWYSECGMRRILVRIKKFIKWGFLSLAACLLVLVVVLVLPAQTLLSLLRITSSPWIRHRVTLVAAWKGNSKAECLVGDNYAIG